MSEQTRITMIVRDPHRPDIDWTQSRQGAGPVFTESLEVLHFMLKRGMEAIDLDIERFVIDRAADDAEFLDLLTRLPESFAGDALHVRADGSGFLSAAGRGGGRFLYALQETDVRFYLEAHELVTGRIALQQRLIA